MQVGQVIKDGSILLCDGLLEIRVVSDCAAPEIGNALLVFQVLHTEDLTLFLCLFLSFQFFFSLNDASDYDL